MWSYSPWARPVGSFERPVPLIFVEPCENPDLRLEFRHEWLPYVLGALKQLLLQSTWKVESAEEFYAIQGKVANLLSCFALAGEVGKTSVAIEEMAIDMTICEQLRYNPSTHKFEGFCCGEWTPIPGQEGIQIAGPTQDGSGSPQPTPGGGCQTYHAVFDANGQYLVPTVVSAGDTLSFSNSGGAATNGDISGLWYCPNGQTFFANGCIGTPGNKVGDVTTDVGTMAIVANVGGTWYKAFEGTFTVPGGVSNAQVYLQANDSPLDDNKGSYAVDVEVCNNQVTLNSHTWDFALSDGGFTVEPNSGDPGGEYIIGVGWKPTIETGASHWYELFISKTIASMEIFSISAFYSASWTTNTEPGSYALDTDGTGISASKSPDQGTNISFGAVGDAPSTTKLRVDFNVGKTVSGHLSGQDFVLKSLTVTFNGADPF